MRTLALLLLSSVGCGSAEEQAARASAEKADRDARRAKVKAAICVEQNDAVYSHVTHRFIDEAATETLAVVAVRPELWSALNMDMKLVFAGWAALCQRSKDRLRIIDGNSGDDLKLWSLDGGLR